MQFGRQERLTELNFSSTQNMDRTPLLTRSMAAFAQVARRSSQESQKQQLRGRCTPPNTPALDSAILRLPLRSDKAMDLACLLPLHVFHHSYWKNPKESIGEPIGPLRNGRYQCWHPIGPALKTLHEFERELAAFIGTCPKSGGVHWGMFMVGHREDNAAPKVLICSEEKKIRKTIKKMVRKSKILDQYPGIALGDVSSLPDRGVIVQMAKEAIEKILPPGCDMMRDKPILIEGSETAAGKRIYTVNSDGQTMHAATAGPFVFINDTWCQLTVSHPFFATRPCVSGQLEVPEAKQYDLDDCEFEDMTVVDEEADLEATTCASVSSFSLHDKSSLVEDWLASPPESQDNSESYVEGDDVSEAETSDTVSDFRPSNRSDSIPIPGRESLDGIERTPASAQQIDLNPSRLQYLGKLGLASDEFEESPLDYAVIVINNGYIPQFTAPQVINRHLIITKSFPAIDLVEESNPWKDCVREIGLDTIDVITLTPRGGPVSGKLIPNPLYLRIANKSSFYRVFPLMLESIVSGGDCGSPSFDASGRFCGHIVAGGLGTSHAYIMPASDILNDLESRIWGNISLSNEASIRLSKPIGTPDYTLAIPNSMKDEVMVPERRIVPPPHLRKYASNFDPRLQGSIAASLRQATLGIVNPMGLSSSELLASGTSPGGLTVVISKGELFDDLAEGGQDPTAMSSPPIGKDMALALRVADFVPENPHETSLTHQDHNPGVKDKLRSKSKFGRWRSTQSTHSHGGMKKFVKSNYQARHGLRDAVFHQDLGAMD